MDAGDRQPLRSLRARVGIAALNLANPGLGLVRLGLWRSATFFFLAQFFALALAFFAMGHVRIASFGEAELGLAAIVTIAVMIYVASIVITWRESRARTPPPRWSRWYGLLAVVLVISAVAQIGITIGHCFYRSFYAPGESMAPTIVRNDRFFAAMRWRGPPRVGDIVLFHGPDNVRISRLVALGGDRVAMHGGIPVINGEPAQQAGVGRTSFSAYDGVHLALARRERLPSDARWHRVLDSEATPFDETEEVTVPPGYMFVLGDNRDRSADSRVPRDMGGVGMVSVRAIIGRPMYIDWSSNRATVGKQLDR